MDMYPLCVSTLELFLVSFCITTNSWSRAKKESSVIFESDPDWTGAKSRWNRKFVITVTLLNGLSSTQSVPTTTDGTELIRERHFIKTKHLLTLDLRICREHNAHITHLN